MQLLTGISMKRFKNLMWCWTSSSILLEFWYFSLERLFTWNYKKLTTGQICSSQWTAEEQDQAVTIAKTSVPHIGVITIPPGLDAREGSEGILSFLKGAIQSLKPTDSKK